MKLTSLYTFGIKQKVFLRLFFPVLFGDLIFFFPEGHSFKAVELVPVQIRKTHIKVFFSCMPLKKE